MRWEKVKIEEICKKVTSGGTPKSSNYSFYDPPEVPWLKTAEVNYCRIYETETLISREGLARSSAKMVPENSVIVAMYGQGDTAGRVAINKIPLCTNQACCNLIINNDLADYEFVYYELSTLYEKIVSLKNGGAQPNLNARIVKSIEIPLPDLKTQHRIASILSAYDSLIENNNKQIKLLEEAATRLYKEWFVHFRFPGHENVKVVNGVPEGWREGTVCEIISFLNGYAFKSKEFSENGKYKIATIKNVQDGHFNPKPANGIDRIPEKMPAHCKLKKGDILLSLTGNVGRVCIVDCEGFLLNQRVAKLESNYKSFTYCLFRNSNFARQIKNLANGTAQKNLSPIKAGQIKFAQPPRKLLKRFEDVASLYFQHILMLKSQIVLASEARDRLLPKLMSGEIEV